MTDIEIAAVATADPIDVAIGARLRLRRLAMGFSQETLARSLGITFQQIQKYERGTNRIFASRLFHLARVLRVPVAYFFHGLQVDGEAEAAQDSVSAGAAEEGMDHLFGRNDSLKLIQAFNRITDASVRRQIYALIRDGRRAGRPGGALPPRPRRWTAGAADR